MRVRVEGQAVDDPYIRYYGLSIDKPLDTRFWETQPETIRNKVWNSFTDEVEVPDTTRYVVVGISAFTGRWHVRVYVNDELKAEGDVAVPGAYPGSPGYLKVLIAPTIPLPPITIFGMSIPGWLWVGALAVVAGVGALILSKRKKK